GLTRPVVPPDGSFILAQVFLEDAASRVTARARQPQAAVDVRDAPIFPRIFSMKLSRRASQHGHAAVQLDCEERRQLRIRADFFDHCVVRSFTYWTTRKFSTEYPCHVKLIRLGCV